MAQGGEGSPERELRDPQGLPLLPGGAPSGVCSQHVPRRPGREQVRSGAGNIPAPASQCRDPVSTGTFSANPRRPRLRHRAKASPGQGSSSFCCEGPGSKHFRLRGPHSFCATTQLCPCSMKAAENTINNVVGVVPRDVTKHGATVCQPLLQTCFNRPGRWAFQERR